MIILIKNHNNQVKNKSLKIKLIKNKKKIIVYLIQTKKHQICLLIRVIIIIYSIISLLVYLKIIVLIYSIKTTQRIYFKMILQKIIRIFLINKTVVYLKKNNNNKKLIKKEI